MACIEGEEPETNCHETKEKKLTKTTNKLKIRQTTEEKKHGFKAKASIKQSLRSLETGFVAGNLCLDNLHFHTINVSPDLFDPLHSSILIQRILLHQRKQVS